MVELSIYISETLKVCYFDIFCFCKADIKYAQSLNSLMLVFKSQ